MKTSMLVRVCAFEGIVSVCPLMVVHKFIVADLSAYSNVFISTYCYLKKILVVS